MNFICKVENGAKEVTSKKESNMVDMTVQLHCTTSHWLTQLHQSGSTNGKCRPFWILSYLSVPLGPFALKLGKRGGQKKSQSSQDHKNGGQKFYQVGILKPFLTVVNLWISTSLSFLRNLNLKCGPAQVSLYWLSFVFRCEPFCAILHNKCSVVFAHTFAQIQIRSDFECPRRRIPVGPSPKQFLSSRQPHTLFKRPGSHWAGLASSPPDQTVATSFPPSRVFLQSWKHTLLQSSQQVGIWFQLGCAWGCCVSIKHLSVGKKYHNHHILFD